MPAIKSVLINGDSVTLETTKPETGTITFDKSMIPANVLSGTAKQVEDYVNDLIDKKITYKEGSETKYHIYIKVKIFSIDPFKFNVITSDSPITLDELLLNG